jgi:hypothetical protein
MRYPTYSLVFKKTSSEEERLPRGYWQNLRTQRKFFDALARQLNIQKQEDWYNVRISDIKQHGGASLLAIYNGNLIKGNIDL